MAYSISDFLADISSPKEKGKHSVSEIWDMITSGSSLEDMGFSTEQEKADFIEQNPYNDL